MRRPKILTESTSCRHGYYFPLKYNNIISGIVSFVAGIQNLMQSVKISWPDTWPALAHLEPLWCPQQLHSNLTPGLPWHIQSPSGVQLAIQVGLVASETAYSFSSAQEILCNIIRGFRAVVGVIHVQTTQKQSQINPLIISSVQRGEPFLWDQNSLRYIQFTVINLMLLKV